MKSKQKEHEKILKTKNNEYEKALKQLTSSSDSLKALHAKELKA